MNLTTEKMEIHSINVDRQDFNKHLMQHLSNHIRKHNTIHASFTEEYVQGEVTPLKLLTGVL